MTRLHIVIPALFLIALTSCIAVADSYTDQSPFSPSQPTSVPPTDTPVPPTDTPPATLTASDASATTLKLDIANHSEAWHYNTQGGSCSAAVSAGTTTTRATGLSFNSSYVFSAYSDSDCSTLLASASSVTTLGPTLEAHDITQAGALINLIGWNTGHDGNWRYGVGNVSCSTAQTGIFVTIGNLHPSQSYTFRAYRNSTCTDEIAQVSFFTESDSTAPGE